MSDTGQTPLCDLLMRVPPRAILWYKEGDGLGSIFHHVPVGNMCRRAVKEITRLREQLKLCNMDWQSEINAHLETERRITKLATVVEAAKSARCEYFTAYPTEGELLKRMQALDTALRVLDGKENKE